MSGVEDVFLRIGENGWLIIADQLPALSGDFAMLSERVIRHVDISYPPFLIHAGAEVDDSTTLFITDLEDLLEIKVEFLTLDEAQFAEVAQPGLYILVGGRASDWVKAIRSSKLGEALRTALDKGALIIVAGAAAAAMGAWVVEEEGEPAIEGLSWLPGAIVLPWLKDPSSSERVKSLLALSTPLYAIGIAEGRLFAFGPEAQREMWGVTPPTLTLGVGWR